MDKLDSALIDSLNGYIMSCNIIKAIEKFGFKIYDEIRGDIDVSNAQSNILIMETFAKQIARAITLFDKWTTDEEGIMAPHHPIDYKLLDNIVEYVKANSKDFNEEEFRNRIIDFYQMYFAY